MRRTVPDAAFACARCICGRASILYVVHVCQLAKKIDKLSLRDRGTDGRTDRRTDFLSHQTKQPTQIATAAMDLYGDEFIPEEDTL
jgi:hypothetical protein